MLKLKLPTDPRFANIAEANIEEILADHAFLEQKAASSAISLIVGFPDYPEVVEKMAELAIEEMEHFQQVHEIIVRRGFKLGKERKDEYIHALNGFFTKGGRTREEILVDKLMFAAMVEARSCERFRVLSENIQDEELAEFYHRLMKSEAGHYSMFLLMAQKYGGEEPVKAKWEKFLEYESKIITSLGTGNTLHG